MKKTILSVFLFFVLLPFSFADSAFKLDLTTDLILGSGSLGLFAASQLVPVSISDPVAPEDINTLDALAIYPYSEGIDNFGTYAAYGTLLLPAAAVLYEIDFPDRFVTYAVMYAEAFLLTFGTKDLMKALVSRYRPFSYLGSVPAGEEDDVYNSFPSGHTSFAFLGATFLTSTFCREYPDSPWKIPLAAGSYALAAAVAVSRVLSGNHFLSDVLCGAAVGGFWGWIVPELHLRKISSDSDIALLPVPGGISLSLRP